MEHPKYCWCRECNLERLKVMKPQRYHWRCECENGELHLLFGCPEYKRAEAAGTIPPHIIQVSPLPLRSIQEYLPNCK